LGNVVGRRYQDGLINLVFSGNGRLEMPLLDFIKAEDTGAVILDCIS